MQKGEKGCISVPPFPPPPAAPRFDSCSIERLEGWHEGRSKRDREISRSVSPALNLTFSAGEREKLFAFAKAAEPRHRNFRCRAPAETADNNGLGASQSRFISLYLLSSVLPSCLYASAAPLVVPTVRRRDATYNLDAIINTPPSQS